MERYLKIVPPAMILGGITSLIYAFILGHASLYIVLFIPVISVRGIWGLAGGLLIFLGILLLSFTLQMPSSRKVSKEYGGFVLIGPFPIIFGSGKQGFLLLAITAIVFLLVFLFIVAYLLAS